MVGKKVYLVGTVHVSKKSMERVEETIRTVLPDMVCVELDIQRFKAMQEMRRGGDFRYSPSVKELMTLPGLLRWLQQEIGKEFGVMPGSEMVSAYDTARKYKLKLGLIDRGVNVTIARMWGGMKFKERMKLGTYLAASVGLFLLKPVFGGRILNLASWFGDTKKLDMKKLEKGEGVDELIDLLKREFPTVHRALVDERNVYMSNNILHILQKFNVIVVVVGLGHVSGMKKLLESKGVEVVTQ